MPKPSALILKLQAEFQAKLDALKNDYENQFAFERHCARVFQMDLVTLALGRMGWGEKRLKQLDEKLMEVVLEMGEDAKEEHKFDPELWVTQKHMEDELKQTAGSLYRSKEERYLG